MTDRVNEDRSRPTRTELVWPGKRTRVERVALPFQVVETVNQSRASREQSPLLGLIPPPLFEGMNDPLREGWKNKLIWGDNAYVIASLLQGDPSIGLEPLAGKIDLIYIDPPFATGQDFSYRVQVGDEEWVKQASAIEETAYRDTWGRGLESYLQMMYDRMVLVSLLLADTGSMYLHCDSRVNAHLRLVIDEVFPTGFRNHITWKRTGARSGSVFYNTISDTILFYTKTEKYTWNRQHTPYTTQYLASFFRHRDRDGRRYRLTILTAPEVRQGASGTAWRGYNPTAVGRHWAVPNYIRPKLSDPHTEDIQGALDELDAMGRIVWPAKKGGVPSFKQYEDEMEGVEIQDIWTDIPPVASQANERLDYDTQKPEALLTRIVSVSSNPGDLVADFFCGSGTTMAVAEKLGRRWIGCDLSRYAIQVSRKRLLDIDGCKPFQVLNLGKYERRHWQVNVLNGQQGSPDKAATEYVRFIVALYKAELAGGYTHLHGQKAGRWVHVGASDAPVTRAEIMDAIRECQSHRYTALDVLGWEWEMGLHDTIREEAKRMGVDLRLLYIPREVMDKREVQKGDIHFYELAYLKTSLLQDRRTVTVRLEDFIIPNPDLVPDEVRSKVKKWSDYIDFWAVDWNYQGDTFHNEWQTYRTRKQPVLRLLSDPHPYPAPVLSEVEGPGKYRILVKVIDIFGNDTTQLLEVEV